MENNEKSANQPELGNAKEHGLRMLRDRAERLNRVLERVTNKVPNTPNILIAMEINGLVKAAWLYCPEDMGRILAKSMADEICQLYGYCHDCGTQLSDDEKACRVGNMSAYCLACSEKTKALCNKTK